MSNLDALYKEITRSHPTPEYIEKQLHPIPDTKAVNRVEFIVSQCKGKKVLDIGSSGFLRGILKPICELTGIDKQATSDIQCDVEKDPMPDGEFELIVAGEILEHLSNPGMFLDNLKKYSCPIIITVPNAFSDNSGRTGIENVNPEHVAWYSYNTLKTLMERHGYEVTEWYWQHGQPYTAEGLIFVVRRK